MGEEGARSWAYVHVCRACLTTYRRQVWISEAALRPPCPLPILPTCLSICPAPLPVLPPYLSCLRRIAGHYC